jgi:hypothetical protein
LNVPFIPRIPSANFVELVKGRMLTMAKHMVSTFSPLPMSRHLRRLQWPARSPTTTTLQSTMLQQQANVLCVPNSRRTCVRICNISRKITLGPTTSTRIGTKTIARMKSYLPLSSWVNWYVFQLCYNIKSILLITRFRIFRLRGLKNQISTLDFRFPAFGRSLKAKVGSRFRFPTLPENECPLRTRIVVE